MSREKWIAQPLIAVSITLALVILFSQPEFMENLRGGIFAMFVYGSLIVIGLLWIILPVIGVFTIYKMLTDRVNKKHLSGG